MNAAVGQLLESASAEDGFELTPDTTVRRHPERANYERSAVHAVLDEALYCDVGFVVEGKPFVIPCIHARLGDELVLHGSVASRLMDVVSSGQDICVTATIVDGLVLARSWMAHSMNYRSVVVFGRGRVVTDPVEKARAARAIVEHVVPGRSREARPPTPKELAATAIVALALERGSVKVRRGLPRDGAEDYELPVWAGEVPLRLEALRPVQDPRMAASHAVPEYLRHYRRPGSGVAAPGRSGR